MIINILKQPKDSYLLNTSGLEDQNSHTHTDRLIDFHPLPEQTAGVKKVGRNGCRCRVSGELRSGGTDWAGGKEDVQMGQRPQD